MDDDRHAFAEIVRRHQSRVRSLLRRLCGEPARADDLAQETFLRAYRALGTFRGDARLSTWLCQIAFNLFRSDAARDRRPEPDAESGAQLADPASRSDLRRDVERALVVLDDDERAAVALAFGHDLTHEEAARMLNIPLGSLKSRLARSLKKLEPKLRAWNRSGESEKAR